MGFESITISPKHRDLISESDQEFIIAVKGNNELSSYSFYFYISDHLTRILTCFSTETGFLTPGEHTSYIAYLINQNTSNYTVHASFREGEAVLALKKCKRPTSIIETLDDYFNALDSASSDDFFNCSFSEKDMDLIDSSFDFNSN